MMTPRELLEKSGLSSSVQVQVLRKMEGQKDLRLTLKNYPRDGSATVLRDSDFQWFEKAVTGIAGLATATSLIGWAPGAIAGLVILFYQIQKKGIQLDPIDATLVYRLKGAGGASADALVGISGIGEISAADIETRLQNLALTTRMELPGSEIVLKTDGTTWRVNGI